MGALEVEACLTHLAVERNVAASTRNQAKSALLFLYGQVLKVELPWLDDVITARTQRMLPVVLTPPEVRALLMQMSGLTGLVAALLYGTAMRLMEGLRLRVKDVEFARRELTVRDGKGGKDRVTVLPENLMIPLREQLAHRKSVHDADLRDLRDLERPSMGSVWLPDALAVKYPTAPRAWGGNGSLRARAYRPTRDLGRCVAITCTNSRCKRRCPSRPGVPQSTSRVRRTCCAIPSPRTCCNRVTTYAPCRNCWATAMCLPP